MISSLMGRSTVPYCRQRGKPLAVSFLSEVLEGSPGDTRLNHSFMETI